jgi:anti-sigma B factor antagonist
MSRTRLHFNHPHYSSRKTMKFNTETIDDITVIEMPMDALDAGNVMTFKTDIAPILDKCDFVVFNMSRVKFVDSSGIGAILSCLRKIHNQGGGMNMCNVKQPVVQLFKLVRIDRIMDIHPTKKDAVQAFQGEAADS